ncbi:MAG: carboxypeptidase-like regulatory domain-containing protein [Crocinitomicaceae bacterium]|nr:carboxypeptidase-like regulatory domain-containing protein [Crocinitomicaceae bacterium]
MAQTGNLHVVVSNDSLPVSYARIKIKNSERGVICDSSGRAQFKNLEYGEYILQISAVGFLLTEIVAVIDQPEERIGITPALSTELNMVVVTGNMREVSLSRSPVKIGSFISAVF